MLRRDGLDKHYAVFSQSERVILLQILHRTPSVSTRYSIEIGWLNIRVDEHNDALRSKIRALSSDHVTFCRLRGFRSAAAKQTAYSTDGTHLTLLGQHKMYNNIRAAVVVTLNNLTQ